MTIEILPIPALSDNYIWLIVNPDTQQAACVDPGEAAPVMQALQERRLQLAAILITHHHWDHTNGIAELLQEHSVPVYGPSGESVSHMSNPLAEGDIAEIPGLFRYEVLDIPGHTRGHIAYYDASALFCGDTLFTAGCGRVFEGTMTQMYQSLLKLSALPDDTLIYCGHEYTENNLKFANLVEPNNKDIQARLRQVQTLRSRGIPTVPAPLTKERQTNPFLRCDVDDVTSAAQNHSGNELLDSVEVFEAIRGWKDIF